MPDLLLTPPGLTDPVEPALVEAVANSANRAM
jgi:hypothetical protein